MDGIDDRPLDGQQALVSLAADVGAALTHSDEMEAMLSGCASALVQHLPAAFARIWVLNESTLTLELKASAGIYTHLDGAHSRIRLGQYKIGWIAEQKRPHLTNSVCDDPHISDKAWAKREGMVAFAGHPLLVQNKLVGVVALFARHTLNADVLRALEAVADSIALGVHRKQIEAKLREREQLFTQFAHNMRDVMWISTPNAVRHTYISPAYEYVFGRSVQQLMENPHSFLDLIVPEDREKMLEFMQGFTVKRDPNASPSLVSDIEYRIRKDDGQVRWLWTRVFPKYDEDEQGVPCQLYGITCDITEKKEAERRVSEFYSMVSHELRTPLTSIRAALGLVEGGMTGPLPDETLELIGIARTESDRLIRLINDILDVRRMEAGKLKMELHPIQPQQIVTRTLSAMRGFAQEHGVELISWINDERSFMGDDDRLVQVMTNLLSNAIKFSPPGKEVSVCVERAGDARIRFSVTDHGPGIPEQQLDMLFGIFQQLDSSDSRAKGGTGLGLAISKGIIDRLGGTIGCDSTLGEGSTFWFELNTLDGQSSVPMPKPGTRSGEF